MGGNSAGVHVIVQDDDRAGANGLEQALFDVLLFCRWEVVTQPNVPHRQALTADLAPATHRAGEVAVGRTHPTDRVLGEVFVSMNPSIIEIIKARVWRVLTVARS